ncbi:MAG: MerR family transcriptional regulator [Burkholderiales bacterium]|nr:MerR family transcriptional regulator [Burkholderiales bacterium]
MKPATASAAAEAAQVNVETLRYYERLGLLPRPPRASNGYRQYDDNALRRLRFIRRAQALGFSLAEVKELLRLEDGIDCGAAQTLARIKLEHVERQLAELRKMRSRLKETLVACASGSRVRCPLIEVLLE